MAKNVFSDDVLIEFCAAVTNHFAGFAIGRD